MDMNRATMRKLQRSRKGQSIAEMPAGLWMLVVGFLIPLLIMATFAYKVTQVYWATRDACYVASVTSTYDPSAGPPVSTGMVIAADNVYKADMKGFNQVGSMVSNKLEILQQPITGGPPVVVSAPITLANLQVSNYMYFIRYTTVTNIPPLLNGWSWQLSTTPIPGLNAPLPITLSYDDYVENPQGLTI